MKKITLTTLFSFSIYMLFSQTYSTGVVPLDTDFTVQFDVNTTTSQVTMTMIGPDNIWLGVGPGISTGIAMGNLGDDAIIYNSSGLQDRNMPAGTGTPKLDTDQNWSVTSNTTNTGVRTLIATRDIDTGDSNDYIFPSTAAPLPILWAKGSSLAFGNHGSNRSGTVANLTLGHDSNILSEFKIFPNPVNSMLNLAFPAGLRNIKISVYNTHGKIIFTKDVSNLESLINVSHWSAGLYLIKISTLNQVTTKRFIKQ